MSKKLFGAIASVALVLSLVSVDVAKATALTQSQISGIVEMIRAFGADASTIANVTASLNGLPTSGSVTTTTTGSATSDFTFTRDLTLTYTGADVSALQQFLVSGGHLVMPQGVAYGYFGNLTKAAVIKYQFAKGITPAAGYFGPKTRGIVNGSYTTTTTTNTTNTTTTTTTGVNITGTDLVVTLAATSPATGAIIATQAAANMAEFTFKNTSAVPAIVTNVTLAKIGVAGDSTLAAVYLYDGAVRLTDSATVSSGRITFNAGAGLFTVPAGMSRTISVRSDIANISTSQQVGVSLISVLSSTVPVQVLSPLSGSMMSVFQAGNGDIASTTIAAAASSSPWVATNIQAGATNYTIWSAPLVVTNKAVYLTRAAFKVVGSIPMDSLTNLKLYVGGVQVASSAGVDSNGYITFDLTLNQFKIETGSKNLEVRADVIKGSSRNFTVSIQNSADIGLVDSNYNVGVTPNIAGKPVTTAKMTVSAGDITFQDDSSLLSGNVVTGSSQTVLGKWTLKAYGEDMKISSFLVHTSTTTKSVGLFANNEQIGSTQDNAGSVNSSADKTYTVNYTIAAGQTVSLELRADMKNLVGNIATGTPVTGTLTATSLNAQGLYSFTTRNIPASPKTGPQMTIVGAGLTLVKSTSVPDGTLLPNAQKTLIGSFIVKADSSEAAIISSMTVTLGGDISTTDLSNLTVEISGVGASTPVNPQTINNITLPTGNFEIAKDTAKTVNVYADINNINSGTTTASLSVVGNGKLSNIDLSKSASGQIMSVTSGTLANIALYSGSPASMFVLGGISGDNVGTFTLKAVNAPVQIKKIGFLLSPSTSTAIKSITFGGKTLDITDTATATLSFDAPFLNVVNNIGGTKFPVVVTYQDVGTSSYGGIVSNQPVAVKIVSIEYSSGNTSTTTYPTTNNVTNAMNVVASIPTVKFVQITSGIASGLVAKIKISAVQEYPLGSSARITSLPLVFKSVGTGATIATGTIISLKTSSGVVVATGTIAGTDTNGTTTVVFANQYDVTGETLGVYAAVQGAYILTEGTDDIGYNSVTTYLGSPTLFSWVDVEGDETAITDSSLLTQEQYNTDSVEVLTY